MAVIAGSMAGSGKAKADRPSLIVAQVTGKIVHVSERGALFLRLPENYLVGRDIRDVMPVELPPRTDRSPHLHKLLKDEGTWIDRAIVPGPAGSRPVRLTWRAVPLGWLSYWVLTMEGAEAQAEDPLMEGFLSACKGTVEPAFRLLDHPRVGGDNWRLVSFHWPLGARGGDVLFIEELGPDHLLYFLGDVAGHHHGAALVRLMLTTYLRVYREEFNRGRPDLFPGMLLGRMNCALAQDEYNDCLLTAIAMVLEKRGSRAYFASAGHHPMFLVRPGRSRQVVTTSDIPLGIRPRERYRSVEVDCAPGDRLLCYTDGLITAGPTVDFRAGLQALLGALEECGDAAPEVLAGRIQRLCRDKARMPEAFEDDVTFSIITQARLAHRELPIGKLLN